MRVLGITAEYDPFHNGHLYHLETAKATVNPDVMLCVMSGNITQRGHLAVIDKWTRAKTALDHGLDLVLELPFIYACSAAESFAGGAVDILVKAGATHISFGCEAEDPDQLIELARLQVSEGERIEEIIREEMRSGISRVKARQIASTRILGEELTILSLTPNNILAIEYLKRMNRWKDEGVSIEPVPIIRKGSGYKDDDSHTMAGGSAIREMIGAGWDVSKYLPYDQGELLPEEDGSRTSPWIDFKSVKAKTLEMLKGIAIRSDGREISKIRFIGEGIENRLIREIENAETYDDLLKTMTSKRYTTSTIRRTLISIMLGITKEESDRITESRQRSIYGRILALNDNGRKLISEKSKGESSETDPLPFIANINKTDGLTETAGRSLEIDVKAADLFNLITGRSMAACSDHRQSPYVL